MKNLFLLGNLAILSLISCNNDESVEKDVFNETLTENNKYFKIPPPNTELKTGYWRGDEITYYELDGEKIFNGDIIVNDEDLSLTKQTNAKGSGLSGKKYRWPKGEIRYKFSGGNNEQKGDVLKAMKAWEKSKEIKFVDISKENDPEKYVNITFDSKKGNVSDLGYTGKKKQQCNLANRGVGIAAHELGHIIGLIHEHTRSDRDKFIKIKFDNIVENQKHNFKKVKKENYVIGDTNKFDYNSIMLYPSRNVCDGSFPVVKDCNKPSMVKKNKDAEWGDNIYSGTKKPSKMDVDWVDKQYKK